MSQNVVASTVAPAPRAAPAEERAPDWSLIAESIPHILWMASPDGQIQLVNRFGNEYTGWPPDAGYDRDWLSVLHPDDAAGAAAAWHQAIRTATAYSLEYRIRRRDGAFRWHLSRVLPVREAEGRVIGWIGTATDIDERKQAEVSMADALQSSEQELTLLAALHAAIPVGLGFVDRNFRLIRVNPRLAAMGQQPVDESACRHILATGDEVLNVPLRQGSDGVNPREIVAEYYPVRSGDEIIGIGVVTVDRQMLSDVRAEPPTAPMEKLTSRERDVLECLREGLSNPAIAKRLGITANTVRNHVQRILHKLDVHSKLEAVVVTTRQDQAGRG